MTQLFPYLLTMGAIILMMFVWVAVQMAWKRTFPDVGRDVDALATRKGCGSCSHDGQCDTTQSGDNHGAEVCDSHSGAVRESV